MTFDSQRQKKQTQSNPRGGAKFIAYPTAMALLKDRLGATPEEMATWVFLGPNQGGFAAYVNASEFDEPPRFYFADNGRDVDYLAPLMEAWFKEAELNKFQPTERFITGKELIARWRYYLDLHVEAFIWSKIKESRLLDIHPITGTSQGSTGEALAPLETALFMRSHVQAIEAADFGERKERLARLSRPSEQTARRNQRLQDDANALARQWKQKGRRSFSKGQIAQALARTEEWQGMEANTIERLLRAEWNLKRSP